MTETVTLRWDDLFYQPHTAVAYIKPAGAVDDVDFETNGIKVELKKQDQGGSFEGTVQLKPGVYQFLFILDNTTWRHSDAYLTTTVGGKTINYMDVDPGADNTLAMHHTQVNFTDDLFDDPTQPLLQDRQAAVEAPLRTVCSDHYTRWPAQRYGAAEDYDDDEDQAGDAARRHRCCRCCRCCNIM